MRASIGALHQPVRASTGPSALLRARHCPPLSAVSAGAAASTSSGRAADDARRRPRTTTTTTTTTAAAAPSGMAAAAATPAPSQARVGDTSTTPLTSSAWLRGRCPQDHRDALPQLLSGVEAACRRVASRVARAGLDGAYGYAAASSSSSADGGRLNASGDAQKKLDVVADELLAAALAESGLVRAYASEEADEPVVLLGAAATAAARRRARYVVAFDPLDGSRNVDVAIPTGTIFGVYESLAWRAEEAQGGGGGGEQQQGRRAAPASSSPSAPLPPPYGPAQALADVLQPGRRLVASGYCLYSSAVVLALATATATTGDAAAAAADATSDAPAAAAAAFFALDALTGDFVATHGPRVACPARGQIYSLNDARFDDWPAGLQRYVSDARSGRSQTKRQYSARYVCSLVADLHRTLLQGGWCGNPRPHLRLLYEGNPLAFLVEAAGGRASDGARRVLDIVPERTHQRLPLFLGSKEDVAELESYGDVQQTGEKKYAV